MAELTTGWLRLKNLSFWGRHGHLSSERELGNRFELDIELKTNFSLAARSDRLEDAVDLRQVYEIARQHLEGEPCALLETLVSRIAQDIAKALPVLEITVRLRKMTPPLKGATSGIMEAEVTLVL